MKLESGLSGRDHYLRTYETSLDRQAEWLRRGALGKVDSVATLLGQHDIHASSILELGCGTGAVICELKKRGLGRDFFALDSSPDAVAYLTEQDSEISCAVADVMTNPNPFGDLHFDVVILSHVVEHLETPLELLRKLHELSYSFLIVEVPLENLFFGKAKALIKDRSQNPAGHVQFFNRASFRSLIDDAGLTVVGDRLYPPIFDIDTLRFQHGASLSWRFVHKFMTEHALPRLTGPLWKHVYHAHYAVLCTK